MDTITLSFWKPPAGHQLSFASICRRKGTSKRLLNQHQLVTKSVGKALSKQHQLTIKGVGDLWRKESFLCFHSRVNFLPGIQRGYIPALQELLPLEISLLCSITRTFSTRPETRLLCSITWKLWRNMTRKLSSLASLEKILFRVGNLPADIGFVRVASQWALG